jgi:hypothetical protein
MQRLVIQTISSPLLDAYEDRADVSFDIVGRTILLDQVIRLLHGKSYACISDRNYEWPLALNRTMVSLPVFYCKILKD